jgi:2,2-dialkylglycine decarboxylase (pyruvate)
MDDRELRRLAGKHLIPSGILTDVVPAEEGPIFVRAKDSLVWDAQGREYLDFNSGQMCSALGHNNERIAGAVAEAARTLTHASSVFHNAPQIELAKRIADTVEAPLGRSLFLQSGADSNECAALLARRATGRNGIGALSLAFHGFSDATRAMSFFGASPGYGPSQPDIHAMPTPYCYRCPHRRDGGSCCLAPLHYAMETLDKECPGGPAAVIVEPVISAGGVIELPREFLAGLRREMDKRGALLIYDEAQTGLGKLGTMYAYQGIGVRPDLMTLSKHLGGGLAVSAVVTTDDISERATRGGFLYAHSHSADPICCRAGVASIDEIVDNGLPERAAGLGEHWQGRMRALQQKYELIGDIRGRGLLQGIELVRDRRSKEPADLEADAIFRRCLDAGLLFSLRGRHRNVFRFVPPFTTTEAQLDRAADILDGAIGKSLGRN